MKYEPIDNKLFIENRSRFIAQMKPKSIAIFNSNDIMPTNADGTMGFRQNNDLFYLSGIDQEDTILVLFPDAPKSEWKEILFIKETNERILIWEGHKLSQEQAHNTSGVKTINWTKSFESTFTNLVFECEHIYLNTNEHIRSENKVQTRDNRFIEQIKNDYPLHKLERSALIMNKLRAIKSETEIELIKKAIEITSKGFERVLHFVKPEVAEYEIEAEITHEFLKRRATRHAYHPIIASGADSCVLHYNENNKTCKNGDLILLDFGAEYANYNADLTRTIPVNGIFSERQKAVYQAVLRMLKMAKTKLVVGNSLENLAKEMGIIAEKELLDLGLLKAEDIANQNPEKPLYKKYFMHGISHYLGLDVHDIGSRYRTFEPGMVFTCEPGIYIKEESIGIRLENNILITKNGNIDLMAHIPIEIEEIELLMQKN